MRPLSEATPKTLHEGYSLQARLKTGALPPLTSLPEPAGLDGLGEGGQPVTGRARAATAPRANQSRSRSRAQPTTRALTPATAGSSVQGEVRWSRKVFGPRGCAMLSSGASGLLQQPERHRRHLLRAGLVHRAEG